MAIWLTHSDRMHAGKVAESLGVSVQAVWLWIGQYNDRGPAGLLRNRRGGRRWAFMTPDEEAEFLRPFVIEAQAGTSHPAARIKAAIEKRLNRGVSTSYVYRLLRRHGWADILAQSQHTRAPEEVPDTFENLTRPWLREA